MSSPITSSTIADHRKDALHEAARALSGDDATQYQRRCGHRTDPGEHQRGANRGVPQDTAAMPTAVTIARNRL